MIKALRLLGLEQDADRIESLWEKYITVSNYTIAAEYYRCFPEFLVDDIVGKAKNAIDSIGCKLIVDCNEDDVRTVFNAAWKIFWDQPNKYLNWEKEQIDLLESSYCK